jgi:hypothetical protein
MCPFKVNCSVQIYPDNRAHIIKLLLALDLVVVCIPFPGSFLALSVRFQFPRMWLNTAQSLSSVFPLNTPYWDNVAPQFLFQVPPSPVCVMSSTDASRHGIQSFMDFVRNDIPVWSSVVVNIFQTLCEEIGFFHRDHR